MEPEQRTVECPFCHERSPVRPSGLLEREAFSCQSCLAISLWTGDTMTRPNLLQLMYIQAAIREQQQGRRQPQQ